jgi:hypothetical protein
MKNGFAPNGPVNGFADQRLRAFVDDVVAPAYRERRAADRAEFFDRAYNDTMIGQGIQAMISGLTLPGDVAQGKFSMDDPRAIERVFDLASSVTLGAGAIPGPKNSLRAGIKAYHGSPHDFDKFSLDKIGTGEGAQAFGHGLYFADSEDVARSYRDQLAKNTFDGFKPDWDDPLDLATFWAGKSGGTLTPTKSDRADAASWLRSSLEQNPNQPAVKEAIGILESDKPLRSLGEATGRMYEVEINANPDDFLDWDVPLKEQPENIQNVLSGIASDYEAIWDDSLIYLDPKRTHPAGDRYPDEFLSGPFRKHGLESELSARGIPGIKYLDGASRAAGEGSRNYVVFDDKLINILRKYGIAVPAGMAGYEMTRDQFNTYVADQQAQQYERDNNMTRMGML